VVPVPTPSPTSPDPNNLEGFFAPPVVEVPEE
jgi:hypothetical protein